MSAALHQTGFVDLIKTHLWKLVDMASVGYGWFDMLQECDTQNYDMNLIILKAYTHITHIYQTCTMQ